MDKRSFIADVLDFGGNRQFYEVDENYHGIPGAAFRLKTGSDVVFAWRDYEIDLMKGTESIDIGYCLSRAVTMRDEARHSALIECKRGGAENG